MDGTFFDVDDLQDVAHGAFLKGVAWAVENAPTLSEASILQAGHLFRSEFLDNYAEAFEEEPMGEVA